MSSLFFRLAIAGLLLADHNVMAASVAPIPVAKWKFTIAKVTIAKPTGDPATAGSADNEFTFMTAAGVATIPVEATITPASLAASVGPTIKWTFVSLPAGTVLTWNNPWPGEATAGQGRTAVATLTGYPTNNSGFGPRTIKMEVIQGTKVVATKTAKIELFFEKYMLATGRAVPNWYFYWTQTSAGTGTHSWQTGSGRSFTDFIGGHWVVRILNSASEHTAGATWGNAGGIDLFANVVRHELQHVSDMGGLWGPTSNRDPARDLDQDFLPDTAEPTIVPGHPYDPKKTATYVDTFNYDPVPGAFLPDAEDLALRRQPAWTNGSVNSQDWSHPGMQHRTNGDPDD